MFDFFKKNKENSSPKLFYTTDIHSHILPGIDDGSPNIEKSIELVRSMQEWGIKRIITTPHVTEETFENTPETIQNAYDELMLALKENDIEMDICFSAEYRMDENFIKQLENNQIIPLPHNHILIENSFIQAFWDLKNMIFQLGVKGYSPILAHPERYAYYFNEKSIYNELHDMGCLFQVNLLSLAGYYGKGPKEIGTWLVNKGYVDFIGTDLHHANHAEAITAFIGSKDYKKIASKLEIKNNIL